MGAGWFVIRIVNMEILEKIPDTEHERILFASDPENSYRGIIAIHSSVRGPAVGGTRFWNYANEDDALLDALRLSRGMTYKNALADLPLGGGKSIIIGDQNRGNRKALFRSHGRFIETLKGTYITGEDVGTTPSDMAIMLEETKHVAGTPNGAGDPSPATAHGVFRAIQASIKFLQGNDDLSQTTVALQGCGHVGYFLARKLHEAGARLIVTDVDQNKVSRMVSEFGAVAVSPENIFSARADIFAPCALGGVLNDKTIPQLRVKIVAGAANNQLLEEKHADQLLARGILYAPDYAANAGGVIHGCTEILGWESKQTNRRVDEIYQTMLKIFEKAQTERISTNRAADLLAETRLKEDARPKETFRQRAE